MGRIAATLIIAAMFTGCASVTPTPVSMTAMLRLQLTQRAGLYPGDWVVPGTSHEAQYAALVTWAERQGVVVAMAPLSLRQQMGSVQPGMGGWIILINRDLGPNAKLYTLLHELGHLLGPHKLTVGDSEVIAEMVAALTCQQLGLDAWPQTAAYLASRVPDLDAQARTVQLYGAEIDAVVAKLVKAARP